MSLSEKSGATVNLANLTDNYVAQDGDVLFGKIAGNYEVLIADGARVQFNKAKTNGIICEGDCTIILAEGSLNTVKSLRSERPGIFVPEGKTLTIDGNGSLNVSSENAAGIGAGCGMSCGNVVIKNGTIKAIGGKDGAGIGGACISGNDKVTYGDVIIYGGSVTVKGGYLAAGIGTGANYDAEASFGNITIKGGVVEAKGGLGGAGIGTGPVGIDSCKPCKSLMKSITISGGSVNAKGAGPAAGIGTGLPYYKDSSTSVESISITDDVIEVTATRGKTPPGRCCIGVGGRNPRGTSTVGSITIGGKVTEGIEKSSFTYKPKKTNH